MVRKMLAQLCARFKEYEQSEPDGRWFFAGVFGGLALLTVLAMAISYLNGTPFPMEGPPN
ncbi:hypothetical protein [uncultured Roseobacter sp.]|uniref:hypothetical protein n=1 Tax=uncultured Roseobacter sp. TaxID=114847 RepID=UPI0026387741|nr:hypothetical protein [uncultured Roseobacter sp.]